MFVLDSHCDTPSALLRGRDLRIDNPEGHLDFPKMKKGGVDAAFFALYTSNTLTGEAALERALRMLAAVQDCLEANKDLAAPAVSPAEAFENKAKGLISIFLGMENGSPIQDSLSLLRFFYRSGVRYMTLTHNGDNLICDSAAGSGRWGGLSPFGREVVREMNSLGMIVDLAHCSDKTFTDCLELSVAPIVSTHSSCRALASHRRNMADWMLKELAAQGGVCQINFYPVFLSDEFAAVHDDNIPQSGTEVLPSYRRVVDHIDHAVEVAGIDHVGVGSDFDGIEVAPSGLEDAGKMHVIFDEMRRRGYSEEDISKVAGGNFLRVFNDVIRMSKLSQK
ncbi:MAG: dipeptidase [Bacteroidales bacterium]|nr:dipeptidase [Bacteroidales bacterium]